MGGSDSAGHRRFRVRCRFRERLIRGGLECTDGRIRSIESVVPVRDPQQPGGAVGGDEGGVLIRIEVGVTLAELTAGDGQRTGGFDFHHCDLTEFGVVDSEKNC